MYSDCIFPGSHACRHVESVLKKTDSKDLPGFISLITNKLCLRSVIIVFTLLCLIIGALVDWENLFLIAPKG